MGGACIYVLLNEVLEDVHCESRESSLFVLAVQVNNGMRLFVQIEKGSNEGSKNSGKNDKKRRWRSARLGRISSLGVLKR